MIKRLIFSGLRFYGVGGCDGIVAEEGVGGLFGFAKEDVEARGQRPEARGQRPEARIQNPESRIKRPEAGGRGFGNFHRKGAKVAKGRKGVKWSFGSVSLDEG